MLLHAERARRRTYKLRLIDGAHGDKYKWCAVLEDLGHGRCEIGLTMESVPKGAKAALWELIRRLGFTEALIVRYRNGKRVEHVYRVPPAAVVSR